MKKKILFMLSTWQDAYSKYVFSGIEKAAENLDIEIHVINAYGSEVEYFTKELEVLNLADVRKYDGVLMMFNGIGTGEHLQRYTEECLKYNVPAVSIDIPSEGIAYCGIDSYASMYSITEHLIKEHNVTRLQYVGGPENHHDSVERGQAFLNCLKDNNLEPYGFSYYGFMRSSGRKAYADVKASGKPMAEAYVFANDYCALGFCMAAKEDGLIPPKDFLVTGFDNQPEAQNYYPSITTIDRNLDGIGYQSLLHLMDIIDGEEAFDSKKCIPGIVIKSGSCGCDKDKDLVVRYQELVYQTMKRNDQDTMQKSFRDRLCGNDTFAQYQQELKRGIAKWGLTDYRICVNRHICTNNSTKTVGYDDVIDAYGADTYACLDRNECLIPDDFKDDATKIYWFGTLYCKEMTLGYSIFKYSASLLEFQYHRNINATTALAVENIRQSMILNEVNQKLEHLYIMDSLTGLYNRFGYNTFAGDLYKENCGRVYVVFIDMDNLKTINDIYGHDSGDIAIKGVAEAIKSVYTDTDVKVRMGGDEFLIMGPFISEEDLNKKETKIRKYLEEYTDRMRLPVGLEVSTGYSFSEGYRNTNMACTGLESMLKQADLAMYKQKQSKKNSVTK